MLPLAVGCGAPPPCPAGSHPDPDRTTRLVSLAEAERPTAAVCFGPTEGLGTVDDAGRVVLDPDADDRLLAARLVHLMRHRSAPTTNCAAALLEEEAAAWQAELHLRARLDVSDPHCAVEQTLGLRATRDDVHRWLATSAHPRATGLRVSHARRCGAAR